MFFRMIIFIITNISDNLVWTLNGSQVLPNTLAENHERSTALDLEICVPKLDLPFQPARSIYADQHVANSAPLVNVEE